MEKKNCPDCVQENSLHDTNYAKKFEKNDNFETYLHNLLNNNKDSIASNSTFFWGEDLSESQKKVIVSKYNGVGDEGDIEAFIDTTVRSSAKNGLAFLKNGVSIKPFIGNSIYLKYEDMLNCIVSKKNIKGKISGIKLDLVNRESFEFTDSLINNEVLMNILLEIIEFNDKKDNDNITQKKRKKWSAREL